MTSTLEINDSNALPTLPVLTTNIQGLTEQSDEQSDNVAEGGKTTTSNDEYTPFEGDVKDLCEATKIKIKGQKIKPVSFVRGGTILRRYLPQTKLPTFLNPRTVDCLATDLPLAWLGFPGPFDRKIVIKYALKIGVEAYSRGSIGMDEENRNIIDYPVTLANVRTKIKSNCSSLQYSEVWIGSSHGAIFSFASNHDLGSPNFNISDSEADMAWFADELGVDNKYHGWYLGYGQEF